MNTLIVSLIAIQVNSSYAQCNLAVIGDSLSSGYNVERHQAWPNILMQHSMLTIRNISGSGNTSQDALLHTKRELINVSHGDQKTTHVVIAIGSNDALRGISIENTAKNIRSIIDTINTIEPKPHILLVSFELPHNYPSNYRARIGSNYEQISKDYAIDHISFSYKDAVTKHLLSEDKLHPNAAGHVEISKRVGKWLHLYKLCNSEQHNGH